MQPELLREAYEWLEHAERDLLAAQRLLGSPPVLADAAAFHSQQAAEKALKGFLTAHEVHFAKTHLLKPLVLSCAGIDDGFLRFVVAAETLTPYATRLRYPGDVIKPDDKDAQEGLCLASEIVQFVRDRLTAPPAP